MPKFAITYHLIGTDQTLSEQIDADDIQQAGEKVSARFSAEDKGGAIVLPFDQEMYAVPKASVAYCHLRQIVERRRASSSYTWDDENTEHPADAEPAAA